METIKEGRSVHVRPGAQPPARQSMGCAGSEACFRLASYVLAESGVIDAHGHQD